MLHPIDAPHVCASVLDVTLFGPQFPTSNGQSLELPTGPAIPRPGSGCRTFVELLSYPEPSPVLLPFVMTWDVLPSLYCFPQPTAQDGSKFLLEALLASIRNTCLNSEGVLSPTTTIPA